MKINAIILLVVCSLSTIAMADNSYGQSVLEKPVTVKLKNTPLADALERISASTGVRIMYTGNNIESDVKVTLTAHNEKLQAVLKKVLLDNQFTYTEVEGSLLVKPAPKPPVEKKIELPPPVIVTGSVVDDKGQPLIGVSVKIEGLATGAVTDIDGKFRVQVANEKAVLVFSYIGFETQKIAVGKQTSIKVILLPSANSLSTVVVVGYGTTSKKELTSAIATVKAEQFNAGVVATPADLLEGKVAGLNITNDGNPNGKASVTLRGPSSLRAGAASVPFYVIDGVPGADFNLLAPSDIASIDVLKDASAAAIYGSRATNGVIIVTTKKAKAGQLRLTYNGYGSFEKVSNQFKVASADQLRAYVKANGQSFTPANDNGGNTDWQKAVERSTGFSQNHNLSFGGGTDKTTYNGSINYLQNQGIVKSSDMKRVIGRLNITQKALNDKLKLDFSLSNSVTNANLLVNDIPLSSANGQSPGLFKSIVQYLPTRTIYNPDGTFYNDPTLKLGYNPVGLITNDSYKQKVNLLLGNVRGELILPAGLLYNFNLAYQETNTDNNTYYNSASELAPGLNGKAIRSTYEDNKKLFENYLSYAHKWNDKHDFKALFGYSIDQTTTGNGFQSTNQGFISDATGSDNLSLGTPTGNYRVDYGNVNVETLRLISFYSRLNYSYAGKYLLQASLRRDGSNAFGTNKRWGYFPAASAAWRIIDEGFMKSQTLFDDLKLRVGYGKTGNSLGFSPYTPLTLYGTTGSFYYNNAYIGAIGVIQNPNPDLKWESTATLNGGVDFSLFKGRLGGSVDIYNKKTTDMITSVPVSLINNFVNTKVENVGSMTNKGVEIALNGTPVKTKDFTWSSYGNISFNKNKITALAPNLSKIYAGDPEGPGQSGIQVSIIEAGYPLGEFYTLRYLGRTNGVSTFMGANGQPTTTPQSTDQTYAGNAQPTYTFGFGNDLTYKNFSLNFFFRGQGGNKIMNASLASFNQPTQASAHGVPTLTLSEPGNDVNANLYSTRYLESGAFIRLSNATLSYKINVPGNYVHGIRLYVTGTNLFIITKYKGVDPELNLNINNQSSGQFIGVDSNNFYPKTRSFLAGVQVDL
ncbi:MULTISPECIES: SusC/RagA family TonB-linked outer membrane protein [Mucilaginibacter]|nr:MULTISPECIES: TonB-dependent receptor [Mucilaginibacter]QTE42352.1 TonB-dependent receptor [Mucilaginibacter rubeus]QTE48953.1 TonB-dependent receptor [Mucilaginibacter rubeus]QTE54051.1 TonB-dependent receptor [Mucilaginibacter rubeus]QTE66494.1 TonB-dependent receptor [Mucilaginibacter rubeus]QTF65241.1 TonB-dependent receptor [Mucilaginibacter rubeus]